jgi:hypothetical protein
MCQLYDVPLDLATAVSHISCLINRILRLRKHSNAGLQLRRASSIRAEGNKLLEKNAIGAVSCKALLGGDDVDHRPTNCKTLFDRRRRLLK